MVRYFDYETCEYFTAAELAAWFNENADSVRADSNAATFTEYIQNCIDAGTLEPVRDLPVDEIDSIIQDYERAFYKAYENLETFRDGLQSFIPYATPNSIDRFIETYADEIRETCLAD